MLGTKRALAIALVWSSFALAAPLATIVPPEGWTETQVEDRILDGMAIVPGTTRADARVWREARTGALYVLERDTQREQTTLDDVRDAESVFMGTMGRPPISTSRKTVDNRVIVDQVFTTDRGRAHVRGIYALDTRGVLHAVSAQCLTEAPSPACDAALETVALPVDAVPIPSARASAGPDIVDKNSAAYRAGKITGMLFLVLLFGYWFYSNHIKKKPPPVAKVS